MPRDGYKARPAVLRSYELGRLNGEIATAVTLLNDGSHQLFAAALPETVLSIAKIASRRILGS